jgi:D-alanine-D-alanine ligase
MINAIGILTGGDSAEREISLKSCNAINKACIDLGYQTTVIEIDGNIVSVIQKLKEFDFVFIALHGGKGENGIIQGLLDSIKIPYNGAGVLASAIGMEKSLTKQIARCIGINTPDCNIFKNVKDALKFESNKFPVVIKPSADGSTVGLTIVEKAENLPDAVKLASKYDGYIMSEDYINGRELTVTIIGNETFPIVEIVPRHAIYDYECKYEKGMSEYFCPAKISDELTLKIQDDALKIYNAIQCKGYARADFILDENNVSWFLEINTLPGMTETSLVPKSAKAAGISFSELVQMIINEAVT